MSKYHLGGPGVGPSFICYVRAWDDPQWCEQNGLPSPKERRTAAAKRGAIKRAATYRRRRDGAVAQG